MGKTDKEKVIDMAHECFEMGRPFEDYEEFCTYCTESNIEPSEELWNVYLDNYEEAEDEPDYLDCEYEEEE